MRKKLLPVLIVFVVIALVIIFRSRSMPEAAQINKVENVVSESVIKTAKGVFDAFNKDEKKFCKTLIHMDEMGKNDCVECLTKLKKPDFEKATVFSPKTNQNLYYVYLPISNGTFQFIFRKRKNEDKLLLEGVCINKS